MMHDPSTKTTRRALGVLSVLIAAAIVALAFVIGSSIQSSGDNARQAADQTVFAGLRYEADLTCQRLNVTRATDNEAHLQNYQLYQYLLQGIQAQEQLPPSRRPKIPPPERLAIKRLRAGQAHASWTPLINCTTPHSAIKSLSLNPIPFTKRLPPPSALSPQNAKHADPVGSVS